jgi:hypothetical protein
MDIGGGRQAVVPNLVSELERELRDLVEGSRRHLMNEVRIFQRSLVGKVSRELRGEVQQKRNQQPSKKFIIW